MTSDLQITQPAGERRNRPRQGSAVGVTPAADRDRAEQRLRLAQVSTIYTPTNQYWVILELDPQYQRDPSALSMLYIRSTTGVLVPLDSVAKLQRGVGPLSVNHLGQLPSVTLSFDLRPGVSLGEAIDRSSKGRAGTAGAGDAHRPASRARRRRSRLRSPGMGILLIVAIFVIYLVLGMLYESFIHPITILSGLPSAGLGALLTLWSFGMELNMYAFVGIIMLIGIVKKNAIMMIDFAIEAQRNEGKAPSEAIYEACLVRFRPIMMTTLAALMGTLPIALGSAPAPSAPAAGPGRRRRPGGVAVPHPLHHAGDLHLLRALAAVVLQAACTR